MKASAAAAIALSLPGCASKPAPPPTLTATVAPLPILAGAVWRVVELNGGTESLPPGSRVRFDTTTFDASFGCNALQAQYRAEARRLWIGWARTTEKECVTPDGEPSPSMAAEAEGFAVLTSGLEIDVLGPERIRIKGARGSMVLALAPELSQTP